MKKILAIALLVSFTSVHAESVMKKVCHQEKGKEVCKTIKTHKKVEGTPVPEDQFNQKKKK